MHGSIFWVLLVWGRCRVSVTIIPEAQEYSLTRSARRYTYLFGGLGLNNGVGPTSKHEWNTGLEYLSNSHRTANVDSTLTLV